MALVFDDITVALPVNHPQAYDGQPMEGYYYSIRAYYENFWGKPEESKRPIVLYFHGSGSTGPTPPTSTILKKLIAKGFNYFSCQYFNVGNASETPFQYGYGNVNAPRFDDLNIKLAWWVRSCVEEVRRLYPDCPIVIYGHSMGASAALAWGSGETGWDPEFPVTGIVSSGATVAGLGTGTWNEIWRNISSMSSLCWRHKVNTIMAHADDDPFGPPEYAMRLQMSLKKDSPVYALSAGIGGHDWSAKNPDLLVKWITEILYGRQVTDKNGKPAITGPTAERHYTIGCCP